MKILMQQSVTALSSAKNSGRNQVASIEFKNIPINFSNNEIRVSTESIKANTGIENHRVEITEPEQSDFERMLAEMEIFNRGNFHSYFVSVWKESNRDRDLLSMVICELDFFDEYREYYDQQISEDILLIVAYTLQN
jgi:GGDEF domain-containing protein